MFSYLLQLGDQFGACVLCLDALSALLETETAPFVFQRQMFQFVRAVSSYDRRVAIVPNDATGQCTCVEITILCDYICV